MTAAKMVKYALYPYTFHLHLNMDHTAGGIMQDHLFNQDYRDMIECLQREGVEFMLVGGYAVALHGWPRMTFDIDFWIMANPQNAAAH